MIFLKLLTGLVLFLIERSLEMLYFSTKERQILTDRILSLIRGAKKYLKTGNFFFRDEIIQDELLNASRRGVAVFVLSNLTGNENRGARVTNVKVETDPHISNLHKLEREGVHVHLCRDLHAKFIVADGDKGLIMSANYTPDSLHGNPENGVDVLGEDLSLLEDIFDELYLHPDTILFGNEGQYRYADRNEPIPANIFKFSPSTRLLLTMASKESSNLRECNYTSVFHKILEIIEQSQSTLDIVSWSFNEVEKLPNFIEKLSCAKDRGVRIKLYYGTKGEDWQVKRTLKQIQIISRMVGGVDAVPLLDNHAKCVMSEKEGIMFTTNIDGNRGLLAGFELGYIFNESERKSALSYLKVIENYGK